MKRQIRWLREFKQPVVLDHRSWKDLNDPLPNEAIETGWRFFEKASELTVYVYGSDPVIISVPGVGRLDITEGQDFEFMN
jgi:hypothetical protein